MYVMNEQVGLLTIKKNDECDGNCHQPTQFDL